MLAQETKGKGEECTIWELEKNEMGEEEWEIMEERIKIGLRNVWFNHLMTDPKSRKVIVIESPLLPTRIKEMLARILFSNLNVRPDISLLSRAETRI
jgi:actin-related protein 10